MQGQWEELGESEIGEGGETGQGDKSGLLGGHSVKTSVKTRRGNKRCRVSPLKSVGYGKEGNCKLQKRSCTRV